VTAAICERTDLPPSMCSHCRGLPWNPPVNEAALVEAGTTDEPLARWPRGMSAQFDSDCPACGETIVKGDLIVLDGRRYVCEPCGSVPS
jgi:hypothetical protein